MTAFPFEHREWHVAEVRGRVGCTKAGRTALRGEQNPHSTGTAEQLKECGLVEPTVNTQTKVHRNGTDIETLLEVFLLEIKDKNKFLGISELQ